MAHYAFVDLKNVVIDVIAGRDENELGIDWEQYYGEQRGQRCIRTSYSGKIRGRYAGIGMIYDETLDIFHDAQPYPSWTMDNTGAWHAPISYPTDDHRYTWDEDNQEWVEVSE